jgi:hypothetical protein
MVSNIQNGFEILSIVRNSKELEKKPRFQEAQKNGCLPPLKYKTKTNSVAWVRKRTIPTELPPLVGVVDTNFCG